MIALRQLADELSPEDAVSLASDFLADLDGQLATIREAIRLRNADDAKRHAHSLRGTASIFSLTGLQRAAETIEAACRDGRLDDAESEWDALEKEAQEAGKQLRPAITSGGSSTVLEPMS